jgi:UDP-N-acetylglucosamine 2-epimerase (non-hydrolysing)
MDEGTLIMCGLKPENVLNAVEVIVAQARGGDSPFRLVPDYEPRNVSKKVVRIILSYVEYINRTVWFRIS